MSSPSHDPALLLANLFENGQAMMRQFTGSNASGTGDAPDPIAAFRAASQQMVGLQQDYWKQVAGFWSGMPGAASWGLGSDTSSSAENDKRFANEAWRNDPRFDLVKRNYLAYSSFLQAAVDAMPLDEKAKAKLRYDTGQFIDAMSPANFLVTNPEAMQLAVETGGQSLTEGMRLFFDDLAKGRVSTTDENAYEVGRDLATTPGAVIYENDLIQVIQYAPTTERVHERPLLIIPPCINKFYILDLQPENSLVRYAVEQGHTVFLVSWRNITAELGHLTWDDYLEQGVMQAIDVARAVTRCRQDQHAGILCRRHAARLGAGRPAIKGQRRRGESDAADDHAGLLRYRRDRRAGERRKRRSARSRHWPRRCDARQGVGLHVFFAACQRLDVAVRRQ